MSSKTLIIPAGEREIQACLFSPSRSNDTFVVLMGGMGVPQRFYRRFAHYLSNNGYFVLTADYSGIGKSLVGETPKEVQVTCSDWVEELDELLRFAVTFSDTSFTIACLHSLSGQLFGLTKHCLGVDLLVTITSQLGYIGNWRGIQRAGTFFLSNILIPSSTALFGYFPAPLFGAGEAIPSGVARQWAEWSRDPNYFFAPKFQLDISNFSNLSIPHRCYAVVGDLLAPPEAVKALANRYENNAKEFLEIDPTSFASSKFSHNDFFREVSMEALWPDLLLWMRKQLAQSAMRS